MRFTTYTKTLITHTTKAGWPHAAPEQPEQPGHLQVLSKHWQSAQRTTESSIAGVSPPHVLGLRDTRCNPEDPLWSTLLCCSWLMLLRSCSWRWNLDPVPNLHPLVAPQIDSAGNMRADTASEQHQHHQHAASPKRNKPDILFHAMASEAEKAGCTAQDLLGSSWNLPV